jgi:formyl-CoA transferase
VIAILAALFHRDHGGAGQHIDLGLLDVGVGSMANIASAYLGAGVVSKRNGGAHPSVVPSQVFRCSDGHVIVAAANDSQFAKLCEAAGRPEIAADERFATNSARVRHRAQITPLLEQIFLGRSTSAWTRALAAAGVPCGPIYTMDQVFEDPQVKARGMTVEIPYAPSGKLAMTANPIRMSATPPAYELPPPLLGEHTEQVLGGMLGLSAGDIGRLRGRGAI